MSLVRWLEGAQLQEVGDDWVVWQPWPKILHAVLDANAVDLILGSRLDGVRSVVSPFDADDPPLASPLATSVHERSKTIWIYRSEYYAVPTQLQAEYGPDAARVCTDLIESLRPTPTPTPSPAPAATTTFRERVEAELRPPASSEAVTHRAPIPPGVKREVWQRDRGRCIECGSNEKLEFDHIIPWSRGGSDSVRNLQLLCEPCNRRKGSDI